MRRLILCVLALLVSVSVSGCGSLSRSKQPAPQASMRPPDGTGIYPGCVLALDLQPAAQGLIDITGFTITTLPVGQVHELGVMCMWYGADGQHKAEVRLTNPNGDVLASADYDLDGKQHLPLVDPDIGQPSVHGLDLGNVLVPGVYFVHVSLDGAERAVFTVRFVGTRNRVLTRQP